MVNDMSYIAAILGLQGKGKTMLMTYFGVKDYEMGDTIYSNYHLNDIPYKPVSTLADLDAIRGGTFLFDECWTWLFSRTSMSKMNQQLMKVVMLNRKRDVNIYYTAQLQRSIDVLLREVTNYFIYPTIKPYTIKSTGETTFRLCFIMQDILGNQSIEYVLPQPLEVYGGFFDTREEIGSLTQGEEISLNKGIQLEEKFSKALSKVDFIKHVELLPNSGIHSTWNFDVIGYSQGKTFAFDVKGVCQSRVNLNDFGKTLQNKINNAKSHNALPFIAFPRNDRVQLTNSANWFVCPLNQYSYLLTLSSNPAYKKLVEHSQRLVEMK